MKLIIQQSDRTITIEEESDGIDCYGMVTICREGLLAQGYQAESIEDVILQMAEEINEVNKED